MTTFNVSPSDLESLASQISGLLGEVDQAAAEVSSGASAAAQNAQLEGAIEGFLQHWSKSIQAVRTSLTEVANRLSGAGDGYEHTERAIVDHLT